MIPGGLTEAKPATPEIQEIANEEQKHRILLNAYEQKRNLILGPRRCPHAQRVKSQLEEKTNETYEEFKAVEYKTQVVAGVNYYIKIQVSEDVYIHIKVFKSLPHENQTLKLTGYQTDKTKDDEITGF